MLPFAATFDLCSLRSRMLPQLASYPTTWGWDNPQLGARDVEVGVCVCAYACACVRGDVDSAS